ncbi:hypothetical protein A3Q37_01531 [Streptomyces sp. PTY087I2]|nr:hypothetical protein A3Q37_01531 [Streptomyces sp. PTY087I2]
MANFVLGLQGMESEANNQDVLASSWTSVCCKCSWISTSC